MATTNVNFRVKNGLEVLGSTATIAGNQILTSASTLSSLSDINLAGVQNGYSLVYDSATSKWIASNVSSGSGGGITSATSPILWNSSTGVLSFDQTAQNTTNDARYAQLTGSNVLTASNTSSDTLVINAVTGQTGDLQRWSGQLYSFRIDGNGEPHLGSNTYLYGAQAPIGQAFISLGDDTSSYITLSGGELGVSIINTLSTTSPTLFVSAAASATGPILSVGGKWSLMSDFSISQNASYGLWQFMSNSTGPTTNPTDGGYLYVESGALKFLGSSGGITTIAPSATSGSTTFVKASSVGQADGVASLDSTGKVPLTQLPPISGGGAAVTVSDTPPATASEGDLWFDSSAMRFMVYYDSYWIEASAPVAAVGLFDGGYPASIYGGVVPIDSGRA